MILRMEWMLALCITLAGFHYHGYVVDAQIGGTRAKIQVVNNRINLLIGIDERVKEDRTLIRKIQDYFTEASELLLVATKYMAMLGDIALVVPAAAWTEDKFDEADTETFTAANIQITTSQRNIPYVMQPSECGIPGDCMYLTDSYLLGDGTIAIQDKQVNFPPAETILHELGHLLFGTFDESPLSGDISPFYHDSEGSIKASACGKNIQGDNGTLRVDTTTQTFYLEPGCAINPATSLPADDCTFWPNVTHPKVTASIMDSRSIFVPGMVHFCDGDATNAETLHNAEAPTRHNDRCQRRSAMAVRPDFENDYQKWLTLTNAHPTFIQRYLAEERKEKKKKVPTATLR